MPCYHPLKAWRSSELTSKGKNRVVFSESYAHSLVGIQLPCGQCIGCKLARSSMWATRCVNEAQLHNQNCFITLTYSQEHLPQDGQLLKFHFQDFIKRLRYHFSPATIRYYMCGEYGEKLHRPHFHACLFGIDFPDKDIYTLQEGTPLWSSEILDSIWSFGFCTIGDLNFQTAAYTARYIAKKITGEKAHDHYRHYRQDGSTVHLEPEYNSMSLKPGISSDWYNQYKTDIYPSDYLIQNKHKIPVPRYYDKLYELDGEDLETIKHKRKKNALKRAKENTPERLLIREKVKQLNYKQLSRTYENEA